MARGDEVEPPPIVEDGPFALERVREERFRHREIDARERAHHRVELIGVLLDATREFVEDALDLGALGELGLAERVVRLEDLERLDEDGRTRRGLVVDDALHGAAHLGSDGDDVAAAALRDDRLL